MIKFQLYYKVLTGLNGVECELLDLRERIKEKLKKRDIEGYQINPRSFRAFQPIPKSEEDIVEIKTLKLCVQRPRRKSFEERRKGFSDVWWGAELSPSEQYAMNFTFSARDYQNSLTEVIEVSLEEALRAAEWQGYVKRRDKFRELLKILDNSGWKQK